MTSLKGYLQLAKAAAIATAGKIRRSISTSVTPRIHRVISSLKGYLQLAKAAAIATAGKIRRSTSRPVGFIISGAFAAIIGIGCLSYVAFTVFYSEERTSGEQIAFAESAPLVDIPVSIQRETASGPISTNEPTSSPIPVPDEPIRDPWTSGEIQEATSTLTTGTVFAKIYVPRFGATYVHAVAEGTSLETVLNKVGIGHYSGTQMPGEVGNFALAGHRFGNGGPMRNIDKFKTGDRIYVRTSSTWFIYRYLETKVVEPSEVGAISSKPKGLQTLIESGKYLTLTSCTPIFINSHRIIAWFGYESEQPISEGTPIEVQAD